MKHWIASVLLIASGPATAAEGMWSPERFPYALAKSQGEDVNPGIVERMKRASVRLFEAGGSQGSASVVSAQGLVLTNQHAVRACLSENIRDDREPRRDGWLAAQRQAELACAGMKADVLLDATDVTAMLATGATAKTLTAERCGQDSMLVCELEMQFGGKRGIFHRFRRYTDVRLVFAPENAVAYYGGAAEDFDFRAPRLDLALIRLYRDGVSASTPDHLTLRAAPPKEGEFVMQIGSTAQSFRNRSAAWLAWERDVRLPFVMRLDAQQRGLLLRFAQESETRSSMAAPMIDAAAGSLGDSLAIHRILSRSTIIPERLVGEATTRQDIQALGALETIAKAQEQATGLFPAASLLAGGDAYSEALQLARLIVRTAGAGDDSAAQLVGSKRQLDFELETLNLGFLLLMIREELPPGDLRVAQWLGGKDPFDRARSLLTGSVLFDSGARLALWRAGPAGIAASADPMIAFVRATDPEALAARTRYAQEVRDPNRAAAAVLDQRRLAALGPAAHPDAAGRPRFSVGKVAGWREGTRTIPATLSLAALPERAAADGVTLSKRWQGPLVDVPVAVATTIDAHSGSSGSPITDRNGEVVAVVNTGNRAGVGGLYGYDPETFRTIGVGTAALLAVLREQYDAKALTAELTKR